MQFPWVLVFDLGISTKRCHTILKNPQGVKVCFLRVKQSKNLKSLGVFFSEKYIYLGQSEDRRNVLENTQQDGFRRI